MIDGITILNEYTKGGPCYILGLFLCIATIPCLVMTILFLIDGITNRDMASIMAFIVFLCVIVILVILAYRVFTSPSITYYEVLIDESVSLKEFNKLYEIIEQNGEIFTIKLKG